MMDRRGFIVGGLASLAVAHGVAAQQRTRIWRIGVLTGGPRSNTPWMAFEEELGKLGYVEGKSIVLKYQIYRPDDHADVQTSARELVAAGVDVIGWWSQCTGACRKERDDDDSDCDAGPGPSC